MGINQVIGENKQLATEQLNEQQLVNQQIAGALQINKNHTNQKINDPANVQTILEAQKPAEAAKSIFQSFLQKIAGAAISSAAVNFRNKSQDALRNDPEYRDLFETNDTTADSVSLSPQAKTKENKVKFQARSLKLGQDKPSSPEEEYSSKKSALSEEKNQLAAQYIITSDPTLRKKIQDVEKKLESLREEFEAKKDEARPQTEAAKSASGASQFEEGQIKKTKTVTLSSSHADGGDAEEAEDTSITGKSLLKEYADLYSQSLTTKKGNIGEKLLHLEKELKEKGVSEKEIIQLQNKLKGLYRKEITEQIKDDFLNYTLANKVGPRKGPEARTYHNRLTETLSRAAADERLGGLDFGRHDGLSGAFEDNMDKTWNQINFFLEDELGKLFLEKTITGKADKGHLDRLIDLGARAGFNEDKFLEEAWPKMQKDLGLKKDLDRPASADGQTINTAAEGFGYQNRKKQQQSEEAPRSETEILASRLRALYYKRALGGKWAEAGTAFSMIKVKNGLIKLGVFNKELEKDLQDEAVVLARTTTLEEIKKIFLEQATFVKLSGDAYKVCQKKQESLLKTAKRLGMELAEQEIKTIQDTVNKSMFHVCRCELEVVKMALEDDPTDEAALARQQTLLDVMGRLKEESNLPGEIPAPAGAEELELLIKPTVSVA